ncbi:MAG TPA: serine hydrolase [Tepidiformaceae bacterium]|nr:serine hydrolase [Tepidiformaceae bacterium]
MSPVRSRRHAAWRLPLLALVAALGLALGANYASSRDDSAGPIPTDPAFEAPDPPLPGLPSSPPALEGPEPPAVVDPEIAAGLLALQERMQAAVDGYRVAGNFAVAVTDLQTGQTISVYGDRQQVSGCLWNLPVIIRTVKDVQEGRYPLSDVEATIRQTLWASDATAALRLYGIVGSGDHVAGVQRVLDMARAMGLQDSVIDHPPAFVEYSLGISEPNLVTAEEVNALLRALYGGRLLDDEWTSWLLEAMTRVKPGLNYLTAYGTGGTVSHKNGFLPNEGTWVDNDAGIVRFERDGQEYAYAITFLSEGVRTKYADIPLGQELSKLAWEYFDAAYAGE